MLELRGATKRFGQVTAVDAVTFGARAGEIVGLLGPNGAGKTTTVSMIAGLLRPDAGEVLVNGRRLGGDTDPFKHSIGLVTQELALLDELTAVQNLHFFAALYDLDRKAARRAADAGLDLVGLADRGGDKVKTFSGGMRRRLNIAVALVHDPEVLLLDEPTVGVDPQSRNAIFDDLETLKQRGKTLLYTTHYMEEAERLCDRIVILDHGRVIADDTLQGLYRLTPASNMVAIELEDRTGRVPAEHLQAVPGVTHVEVGAGAVRVGVADLSGVLPVVLRWLTDHAHPYRHVVTERADLESVFLTLTGRTLRD